MALSQKHFGKVIVPWYSLEEWTLVRQLIFSNSIESRHKALKILEVWKTRTPILSAGIEGTLILLEALLIEKENYKCDKVLSKLYSIALLRFLNVSMVVNDKQGTFNKNAAEHRLPKWIINIRHDIAHDVKYPSISLLETALDSCLEYLKSKYWDVQDIIIKDFTVNSLDVESNLLNVFQSYVNENLKDCKKVRDYGHIKNLEEMLKNELKNNNNIPISAMCKILIKENALLYVDFMEENGNRRIESKYRDKWSKLLNILNEYNLMYEILRELVCFTVNQHSETRYKETASLWVKEICNSLIKMKEMHHMNKQENNNNSKITQNGIISYDGLNFTTISNTLENLENLISEVLRRPTEFTKNYLVEMLTLNGNSKDYITDIFNTVNHATSADITMAATISYTLDDLPEIDPDISFCSIMTDVPIEYRTQTKNKFSNVPDPSFFRKKPLGVLHDARYCNNYPVLQLT